MNPAGSMGTKMSAIMPRNADTAMVAALFALFKWRDAKQARSSYMDYEGEVSF